jgi:1,4-dihydroxy-2-naphthoyl-CoA hydrolase
VFEYRFDLGMSSVDAAGVLYYPELFRHAHDAYEAFMAANAMALHEILAAGRRALPIVHAEADYRRPLTHGTAVTVELVVARLGESSFVVDYAFRGSDGVPCASVRTVHVLIDRASGTREALPEAWRSRLQDHVAPPRDA